ncbi:MAG: acyl-CoA dehydrogenase [Chitinophagales bacterium]
MASKYIDMNTLRYLLYEVHNTNDLFQHEYFQDYDRESVDMFLDAVKDYSDQELYPCFREMDEDPSRYDDGTIYVIPQLKNILEKGAEMGFVGSHFDYDEGGVRQPGMLYTAVHYIMDCANNNISAYFSLPAGAANLIRAFGTQELKDRFIPNIVEGKWGGTLCLTEPQAGSSLSDVTTTASPNENGSYQIKGQKIFITAGDHPYFENFVHLVLARIAGAPAGTKGISLFAVPKFRVGENGELESNDVITAGDFQKVGQRGLCTTHLIFGEKNNSQGWLVGDANRGLKHMFQMMNEARIGVGRGAAAIANAAYYASLQYANERPQGRRLNNKGGKNVQQEQTLIINHADVRRMLLLQKAIAEGSLSLVLEASIYQDWEKVKPEEAEKYHLLLEMLTPIVKTYPAEKAQESTKNGLQILGGYGFCSEFVLQQYARDIRIYSLYEGTTGIQSQDLLGRKVMMKGGQAFHLLMKEMQDTIEAASTYDELKPYAAKLTQKLGLTQKVLKFLGAFAQAGNFERFLSDATLFMDFFGTITIGWQWLKMATAAKQALVTGKMEQTTDFYESKIHTMKFFYKYEMAKTSALADIMMDEEVLTIVGEKELIS